MKNVFYFVLLGFMTCNLTSCKDNDEPSDSSNRPIVRNRPIQIEVTYSRGDSRTLTNITYESGLKVKSYDELISYVYGDQSVSWEKAAISYSYDSNSIKKIEKREFPYTQAPSKSTEWKYELKNGLIYKDMYDNSFDYKEDRLYSEVEDNYNGIYYEWENGNPINIKGALIKKPNEMLYHQEFQFTDHPLYVWVSSQEEQFDIYTFGDPFLVMAGYYGKLPKNLIEKRQYYWNDGSSKITNYKYTFDENGYPTQISIIEDGEVNEILKITWEKY